MQVQRIESPGGIKAFLVESHDNPLVALRFAFRGGAAQDPDGKDGLSYFVTGMMDEGAGDLDAAAYQELEQSLAIHMDFDTARDVITCSFQTLTENREAAFELLAKVLSAPRFDADATERVKGQILASLKFDQNDPVNIASRAWTSAAFKGHPYARPVKGSLDTIPEVEPADLRAYADKVYAKDNLTIVVVGDIDAATLAKDLDRIFGALPETAELAAIPDATPAEGPFREVIEMDIPQSIAQFGQAGIMRTDPDFLPAYILNYIIGGGGFNSRLMEEVREKRGLAYSVNSHLFPFAHACVFMGRVATKNEAVGQSLQVIQTELERLAADGPTEDELDGAKRYLTGAYALRFDSSAAIANQLLWLELEGLGVDYVDERNALIDAVTLDDVARVAKRMLHADRLITTIVGKPAEMPPQALAG
ncbi:pitrilysin family protein [Methyloligella sp. 2.7D]|uniref:M16 family metallopeptidase n=1 Tax=unclassified Methyloligella TaxID=2625955 RepID=UPI00157DC68F|nr:pitrilysin family protein [Methyloligella sp. GL2]QKP78352.1 insulinase family protein [Methyloligella sp. GL2]